MGFGEPSRKAMQKREGVDVRIQNKSKLFFIDPNGMAII